MSAITNHHRGIRGRRPPGITPGIKGSPGAPSARSRDPSRWCGFTPGLSGTHSGKASIPDLAGWHRLARFGAYLCALAQEVTGRISRGRTSSGCAAPVGSKATQPGPPRVLGDQHNLLILSPARTRPAVPPKLTSPQTAGPHQSCHPTVHCRLDLISLIFAAVIAFFVVLIDKEALQPSLSE